MRVCRLRRGLALLAVLGTVMLFLFPVASGPYSATQGPVTALRAMRDCSVLRFSISLAALSVFRLGTEQSRFPLCLGVLRTEVPRLATSEPLQNSVSLRC